MQQFPGKQVEKFPSCLNLGYVNLPVMLTYHKKSYGALQEQTTLSFKFFATHVAFKLTKS
jgi:hypothetical protein